MSKPQKNNLNTAQDLLENGLIQNADFSGIYNVGQNFSIGLNAHLAGIIRNSPESSAVRDQYIPSEQELNFTPLELADPIGDDAHSPVKGIVHRYPDRVLFKVVNVCAVYCRYCFRREMLQNSEDTMRKEEYESALDYIRSHSEIWEVILTGGDPLVLSPRKMAYILEELSKIEHVQVVRIHTRVPIAAPDKLSDNYIQTMKQACSKPLYMVVHVNHADEVNESVESRLKAIHSAGFNMLSQSVLLKGINDNATALEGLFRKLITLNVKPYYLHHPDMAKGTSHFRLSLRDGLDIFKTLLGKISGLCQPSYMLDIPGGFGKVPINASYVQEINPGHYIVEDYQGNKHNYIDDISMMHKDKAL